MKWMAMQTLMQVLALGCTHSCFYCFSRRFVTKAQAVRSNLNPHWILEDETDLFYESIKSQTSDLNLINRKCATRARYLSYARRRSLDALTFVKTQCAVFTLGRKSSRVSLFLCDAVAMRLQLLPFVKPLFLMRSVQWRQQSFPNSCRSEWAAEMAVQGRESGASPGPRHLLFRQHGIRALLREKATRHGY